MLLRSLIITSKAQFQISDIISVRKSAFFKSSDSRSDRQELVKREGLLPSKQKPKIRSYPQLDEFYTHS
jgi:hypothetical protein